MIDVHQIQRLPETFIGGKDMKANLFTQIKRNDKVLLYKVEFPDINLIKYEVVTPRLVPRQDWSSGKGVTIPNEFKEVYPVSDQFPGRGHQFSLLADALRKFDTLTIKHQ
jgi:hypothetical protein